MCNYSRMVINAQVEKEPFFLDKQQTMVVV